MTSPLPLLQPLVAHAPAPLALVDVDHQRVLEVSAPMRDLVGIEQGDSLSHAIAGIGTREQVATALFEIEQGQRSDWTGPAVISRRGQLMKTRLSLTGASRYSGAQQAIIVGARRDGDRPTAERLRSTRPVIAVTDQNLTIERITTADPPEAAHRFAGTSLLSHVHPEDAPSLARDCVHSAHSSSVVRASTRILAGAGPWDRVDIAIHPLSHPVAASSSFFALVLRAPKCDDGSLEDSTREPTAGNGAGGGVDLLLRRLTPREREIARRVADAQRVSGIAKDLVVSPSTIRNHLSAIFRKAGVHSRAELIDVIKSSQIGD